MHGGYQLTLEAACSVEGGVELTSNRFSSARSTEKMPFATESLLRMALNSFISRFCCTRCDCAETFAMPAVVPLSLTLKEGEGS